MNKSKIISIDKKTAYLLTADCDIKKTRWQPDMQLGQEIDSHVVDNAAIASSKPRSARLMKPALVALSVLLLVSVILFFGLSPLTTPVYATVSVDINPSVQFDLNSQLQVRRAYAFNQEGEALLEGLELKGRAWQDAVTIWQEKAWQAGYHAFVLISAVMPDNEAGLKEQLLAMESESSLAGDARVQTLYAYNADIKQIAQENGLSIGRQLLMNQASIQNKSMSVQQIREESLNDLFDQLLKPGERNQTGIADDLDERQQAANRETERETHRETTGEANQGQQDGNPEQTQPTYRETERETHRETTGEANQGQQDGNPEQTQPTYRETERETHRETTGEANQGQADDPQQAQPTYRETEQETHRETTGEADQGQADDPQQAQPAYRETEQETHRVTTTDET